MIALTAMFTLAVSAKEAEVTVSSRSITTRTEVVECTTCVSFRSFVDAMTDNEAEVS